MWWYFKNTVYGQLFIWAILFGLFAVSVHFIIPVDRVYDRVFGFTAFGMFAILFLLIGIFGVISEWRHDKRK